MRYLLITIFSCSYFIMPARDLTTRYERSKGVETATYFEVIDFYRLLDQSFNTIDIQQAGLTDTKYPLHVVYYSKDGIFNEQDWRKQNKLVILINNGIHPGEPDGIDACMMLLRDAALGKVEIPDNIVLAVIPVFNIGGALNRSSHSRANQNGPAEYGFRGNAQNLDLNRDFIKMDARETRSLVSLFHKLDPEIFVDNHVSNGADYQHIMTLLTTQKDKLDAPLSTYIKTGMEPKIYADMKKRGYDLVPYVNHWGETPDKGWEQFAEGPRFTSGFAALFQTLAFVPETHMLKSYQQRVASTYALMLSFIHVASEDAAIIKRNRVQARVPGKEQTIMWKIDSTTHSNITFKGYTAAHKPSQVSGQPRLYYDRGKPYTMQVPFYDNYNTAITVTVPRYYVIPQGWTRVIELLKVNRVQMIEMEQDEVRELTTYRINNMETVKKPYEGHYLHYGVSLTTQREHIKLLKGDYLIPTNQRARRYLVETLEPNAPDAFFAWGFFDAILQQKEHFSDYVFEDEAAILLENDASLKKLFEDRKKTDPAFAKDGAAQLEFIYKHSPYQEPGYMRYPVYRIE